MKDLALVLWGAGRLGLGLVAERSAGAGVATHLAVRSQGSQPRITGSLQNKQAFRVHTPDEDLTVPVDGVHWNDTDKGAASLLELLTTTRDVVFVTSARAPGQLAAVPMIEAAVKARRGNRNPGVFVLAPCENDTTQPIANLAWRLNGKGFVYLDTMVDRICPELTMGQGGMVEVVAETPFEWAGSPKMARAGNVRAFDRVSTALRSMNMHLTDDNDLELIRARKRYLMNGVQTCLALLATDAGMKTLNEYLEVVPDALDVLSEQFAIALAMRYRALDSEDLDNTRRWYRDRIEGSCGLTSEGDTAIRILSRLKPNSSGPYLYDISAKVALAHDDFNEALKADRVEAPDHDYLDDAYKAALKLAHVI